MREGRSIAVCVQVLGDSPHAPGQNHEALSRRGTWRSIIGPYKRREIRLVTTALSIITYVIIAVVGLLYCFRGERYLRVFMLIYGLYLGYSYTMRFFAFNGMNTQWLWLVALGVGLLIGLLAFFFLKLSIFCAGGLLGIALYHTIQTTNPQFFGNLGSGMSFLLGLGFFLILGAVTLALKKPLIRMGTAFYGAYTFTDAIGVVIGSFMNMSLVPVSGLVIQTEMDRLSVFRTLPAVVFWLIVAVLSIAGIIAQYRKSTSRNR